MATLAEPKHLWQVFLGQPDELMAALVCLVKPLGRIVLEDYDGALKRWYPMLDEAEKHAEASRDPELLQVILFFAMSAIPSMQKWAEPRLAPGRVELFFYQLEALARDYACRHIDATTYLRELYFVIMMGKFTSPVRLPHPRHLDEWRQAFRDGDLPDVSLVEGAAVDIALALRPDYDDDDSPTPPPMAGPAAAAGATGTPMDRVT